MNEFEEMVVRIINGIKNGEEWVTKVNNCVKYENGRCNNCGKCVDWKIVHIGDKFYENWEYKQNEKMVVEGFGKFEIADLDLHKPRFFEGNKKECKEWIDKHTWVILRRNKNNTYFYQTKSKFDMMDYSDKDFDVILIMQSESDTDVINKTKELNTSHKWIDDLVKDRVEERYKKEGAELCAKELVARLKTGFEIFNCDYVIQTLKEMGIELK